MDKQALQERIEQLLQLDLFGTRADINQAFQGALSLFSAVYAPASMSHTAVTKSM